MITFDTSVFIKKTGTISTINNKGNKPKDFNNISYSKTKKIKKILDPNPNLDDIMDIKDYIFNK